MASACPYALFPLAEEQHFDTSHRQLSDSIRYCPHPQHTTGVDCAEGVRESAVALSSMAIDYARCNHVAPDEVRGWPVCRLSRAAPGWRTR